MADTEAQTLTRTREGPMTANPQPFVITQDVPPPTTARRHSVTDAMRSLAKSALNSSLWLPMKGGSAGIYQGAWRAGGKGWVALRREGDGYRVWKIAEPKAVD